MPDKRDASGVKFAVKAFTPADLAAGTPEYVQLAELLFTADKAVAHLSQSPDHDIDEPKLLQGINLVESFVRERIYAENKQPWPTDLLR